MYRLAGHHAAPKDEQASNRMEFEDRSLQPQAHWDILQNPALADPVSHQGSDGQRGGDGGSLEVFALSRLILGNIGNRDVETCKTSQAAENEECKDEMVDRCAEPNSESCSGWGDAKGDLQRGAISTSFITLCWGIVPDLPMNRALVPSNCSSSSIWQPCHP